MNARPMKLAKMRTLPIYMHGEWKTLVVMKTRDLTLGKLAPPFFILFLSFPNTKVCSYSIACRNCSINFVHALTLHVLLLAAIIGSIHFSYRDLVAELDELELSLQFVTLGIPSEVRISFQSTTTIHEVPYFVNETVGVTITHAQLCWARCCVLHI